MQNSYLDYKNKIFLGRANTSIWMLAKYLKTRIKKPVIIFPATMCVSPVNIFLLENYKILFVDVDKSTGLMDLNKLGKIKNKKEKILFYVNLYGNHDKIGRILKIKNQFKFIIQDLAQTLFFSDKLKNSKYMFGDFLVTSFGYSKVYDFSHGSYLFYKDKRLKEFSSKFSKQYIKNVPKKKFLEAKKNYLYWYENVYIKNKNINLSHIKKFARYLYLVKPKNNIKSLIDKKLSQIKFEEDRREKLKKIYIKNLKPSNYLPVVANSYSCLWRLSLLSNHKKKIIREIRSKKYDISSYYPNIASRFTKKKFRNASIIENKIINLWLTKNYNKKKIVEVCKIINNYH